MMSIRQPAVAGAFYPDDPGQLKIDVERMLERAELADIDTAHLKALVVPHAGYIYSGPIAATAYKLLAPHRDRIKRVVLLGPSHRLALRGIAIPESKVFRTPLGDIALDQQALQSLAELPCVQIRDDAHAQEHSLEVQLPFLQTALSDFVLIPMVVGAADADEIGMTICYVAVG